MSDTRGRLSGGHGPDKSHRAPTRFLPDLGGRGSMSNSKRFHDRDPDRYRHSYRSRDAGVVRPSSKFSPFRLTTYESFYPNQVIRPNPVKPPPPRGPDDMDCYPPLDFYPSPDEGPEFDYLPPLRGPKPDYHSLPLGCVPTNDPDCDFVCLPPGFIRPGDGVPLPELIPVGGSGTSDFWKHQWDIFKGPPGPDDCIIFM